MRGGNVSARKMSCHAQKRSSHSPAPHLRRRWRRPNPGSRASRAGRWAPLTVPRPAHLQVDAARDPCPRRGGLTKHAALCCCRQPLQAPAHGSSSLEAGAWVGSLSRLMPPPSPPRPAGDLHLPRLSRCLCRCLPCRQRAYNVQRRKNLSRQEASRQEVKHAQAGDRTPFPCCCGRSATMLRSGRVLDASVCPSLVSLLIPNLCPFMPGSLRDLVPLAVRRLLPQRHLVVAV